MSDYAMKDALVSTEWVEANRTKVNVRLIEVDVDTRAYDEAHIEGAVGWNWQTQLCDTVRRDVTPKDAFEKLLGEAGVEPSTTLILYGDNNNWFACWAYWQLKMFGHKDVRIMNGGRKKWILESRPMSQDKPSFAAKAYKAAGPDASIRAYLEEVLAASKQGDGAVLVDVRSPDEYSGKILCPPGLPETCQRGGHIPGAFSIPWGKNCNEDGTFKSAEELKKLYEPLGIVPKKTVLTYCRIGERSSLTWFVLRELLGYPQVKNYDGSWTEWGNLVRAPVARGEKP